MAVASAHPVVRAREHIIHQHKRKQYVRGGFNTCHTSRNVSVFGVAKPGSWRENYFLLRSVLKRNARVVPTGSSCWLIMFFGSPPSPLLAGPRVYGFSSVFSCFCILFIQEVCFILFFVLVCGSLGFWCDSYNVSAWCVRTYERTLINGFIFLSEVYDWLASVVCTILFYFCMRCFSTPQLLESVL